MKNVRLPIVVAITTLAICASTMPNATAVGTGPGTVELAGIHPDGTAWHAGEYYELSGDGTKLVMQLDSPPYLSPPSLYERDLTTNTTRVLLDGTTHRAEPTAISDNGRYVVYSGAATLPDTSNHAYRLDTVTGKSTRLDKLPGGGVPEEWSWGGSISPNGRFVTFLSYAPGLVPEGNADNSMHLFLRDLQTGTTTLVGRRPDGALPVQAQNWTSQVTADGNTVFFSTESLAMGVGPEENRDLFRWDRTTNQTTVVTARADGTAYGFPGGFDMSSTGTWVVLWTDEALVAEDIDNVDNVYRINTATQKARRVSDATAEGRFGDVNPTISPDGLCIGFKDETRARATLYYPATRRYRQIPTGIDGLPPGPGRATYISGISAGCSTVTLFSLATNLVADAPTPDQYEVYVWRDN